MWFPSFVSGVGFCEEHYQKLANRISYRLGMFRGGGGGVYICELEGVHFRGVSKSAVTPAMLLIVFEYFY